MTWFRAARAWFRRLWAGEPELWRAVAVGDVPESLRAGTIYLIGECDYLWSAIFLCPCGCGSPIHLNLLPEARPKWSVIRHSGGVVTISPSVWRLNGCRSHFIVCRGRIEWCRPS